jgi:hypothetical protein
VFTGICPSVRLSVTSNKIGTSVDILIIFFELLVLL